MRTETHNPQIDEGWVAYFFCRFLQFINSQLLQSPRSHRSLCEILPHTRQHSDKISFFVLQFINSQLFQIPSLI